jgi:hypothetical protein
LKQAGRDHSESTVRRAVRMLADEGLIGNPGSAKTVWSLL